MVSRWTATIHLLISTMCLASAEAPATMEAKGRTKYNKLAAAFERVQGRHTKCKEWGTIDGIQLGKNGVPWAIWSTGYCKKFKVYT